MSKYLKSIKGTQDILPAQSHKWQFIEHCIRETAQLYGYSEIRTPVFEKTELFARSVGDATDVVQKEMYTFDDKGGRSVTLRPELTAGAARSFIEHGLFNEALPVKVYYVGGCYRYEKPQSGRLREFHQFGIECFGAASAGADAEVIAVADRLLKRLSLKNIELKINSIGCPVCRAEYNAALTAYFEQHLGSLCPTCIERLERNPMRILDCKSPICSEIAAGAPTTLEHLCGECAEHFESVKKYLTAMEIPFTVDPRIVRGLDYYTKTVFEFVSGDLGAQSTVCGGGRYDGLISQLGGPDTPSLGFAMGLERLLLIMEAQGFDFPAPAPIEIYIAPMGEEAAMKAAALCGQLRAEGFSAVTDTAGRGLKAQMKYADKLGARRILVIGDDELKSGVAELKDMSSGERVSVKLKEGLVSAVYDQSIHAALGELTGAVEKKFPPVDTGM
ncbi:MAG TPA: histidine--tRNA ligase [Ruminococcaceae bacterium]|nr:histidine--tRNA ligase [Oscillospiraceae bacterium]